MDLVDAEMSAREDAGKELHETMQKARADRTSGVAPPVSQSPPVIEAVDKFMDRVGVAPQDQDSVRAGLLNSRLTVPQVLDKQYEQQAPAVAAYSDGTNDPVNKGLNIDRQTHRWEGLANEVDRDAGMEAHETYLREWTKESKFEAAAAYDADASCSEWAPTITPTAWLP